MTIVQQIIALKNYTLQFKKTTLTIFFLMSLLHRPEFKMRQDY